MVWFPYPLSSHHPLPPPLTFLSPPPNASFPSFCPSFQPLFSLLPSHPNTMHLLYTHRFSIEESAANEDEACVNKILIGKQVEKVEAMETIVCPLAEYIAVPCTGRRGIDVEGKGDGGRREGERVWEKEGWMEGRNRGGREGQGREGVIGTCTGLIPCSIPLSLFPPSPHFLPHPFSLGSIHHSLPSPLPFSSLTSIHIAQQ